MGCLTGEKGRRRHCPVLTGWLSFGLICLAMQAFAQSQDPPAEPTPLVIRRNATEVELKEIARAISLSAEKAAALEKSIGELEKTTTGLRAALVQSAGRRKELDRRVLDNEKKLAALALRESKAKASLLARRGLLAEVLAALQRMGRNPPPALLVTPDDALSSVRSAILLGAVVPGIRKETDKLADDLKILSDLHRDIATEKENYVFTNAALMEEERRMDRLVLENGRLGRQNAAELEGERRRSAELAARATSLEGLIGTLERDIDSAQKLALATQAEALRKQGLTPAERQKARALADSGVPDKNRIAPAYPFGELKGMLDLPVAGDLLRKFGDDDGTGHTAQGMTLSANSGSLATAPADGWIVFAGPFRSYGDMIIMNMGDGYHLVISGMGKASARQGQFVVAGEPLGQMGEKRVASAASLALETERPTLYIELRKDGKPVDSKSWWTVKDLGKARNDT